MDAAYPGEVDDTHWSIIRRVMQEQSLESILKGEEPETVETTETEVQSEAETETPKNEDPVETATQEQSEPEDKGVKQAEEPPSPEIQEDKQEESPDTWTKKMALDERQKRQNIERQLKELQQQVQSNSNKQQEQQVELPDPIEDPEGYKRAITASVQNDIFQQRVEATQTELRAQKEDYDDMVNHFQTMVQSDNSLAQKLRKASNPAQFAYETAKTNLDNKKYSDPNYIKNMESRLKEEIEKKVLAELVAKQNVSSPKPEVKLPNITGATSASSGNSNEAAEVTLGDLLPDTKTRK